MEYQLTEQDVREQRAQDECKAGRAIMIRAQNRAKHAQHFSTHTTVPMDAKCRLLGYYG